MNKIKVLLVDDSSMFIAVMQNLLSDETDIEVVGVASDATEAEDKILRLKPDVVTLDVVMPNMSGIEFLKSLLPRYMIPVVMVSSASGTVFDAINAGAVDFVAKPTAWDEKTMEFFAGELITKIKIASIARLKNKEKNIEIPDTHRRVKTFGKLIAMGASTGGTEAVAEILNSFPEEMPGIVVVQHMPPVFTKLYANRINSVCKLTVKEAEDGDLILPNRVLIAPGGMQMRVEKSGYNLAVRCFNGEKVNGHSPSIDVLFNSVAKEAGKDAIGLLLTGMGRDGAQGLLKMKQNGAYTIAQDEKSCVVYGMPKEAVSIGAANSIIPLGKIAGHIINNIVMK